MDNVKKLAVIALLCIVSGCASVENRLVEIAEAERAKQVLYQTHMPRSILVFPPTNDSIEPNASYAYLATVSRPLIERGYYVFPVAVVDGLMKENGLPHPPEMHSVSLKKIDEVFGADAIMYIHISNFGQKFELLSSDTEVNSEARLVDTKTGTQIWSNEVSIEFSSESSTSGFWSNVVEAALTQALTDADKQLYKASRAANVKLFEKLPVGPRHDAFEPPEFLNDTLSVDVPQAVDPKAEVPQ